MLLRDELGKIIDREIEFPEGYLVTITHVVTSPDLRYATVFLSILNADPNRADITTALSYRALEMLDKNVYPIQQHLNRKLRMRPVPRIRFAIDEEEVRRESVERSLAEIKQKGEL